MKIYLSPLLTLSLLSSIASAELVKSYFKTGELKATTNYIDGTNTKIKVGIKNGIEQVYYQIGKIANKVNYVNDKRDGKMTWYNKEGWVIKTLNYKMGKLVGDEITYYKNGQIKDIAHYKNDKREGEKKSFFQNGNLASVVNYIHGKKEGMQKEYFQDGKLYTQVLYKNNYKEGTQKWYDENGKVTNEIFYKMDRPLKIMKKVEETDHSQVTIKSIDFSPQSMRD